MRTRNRVLLVAVLLIAIAGGSIESIANTTSTASELHEEWFLLGYFFDIADTEDEITVFRLLLLDVSTPEILAVAKQWRDGEIKKEEARAAILGDLRTQGDLASLEAFLLGEWVSNVEDAVIDLQKGARNEAEREIFQAIEKANELSYQALHFLDVFSGSVMPSEAQLALGQIASNARMIDVVGLITGSADVDQTLDAILELYDICAQIKAGYGLGN